jgi:16S rRNA G1207 methylase RsmC
LDVLHLEQTARVADLGAGTGYFSVRIAKRVPEGKLFAVGIEFAASVRARGDNAGTKAASARFESAGFPRAYK